MNKKYVIQAFELKLKGRFDVLLRYYGAGLFAIPAQIMAAQIKDELGIMVSKPSIYTLKKRIKKAKSDSGAVAIKASRLSFSDFIQKQPALPDPVLDLGAIVEDAVKQPKGKKDAEFDFTDFK